MKDQRIKLFGSLFICDSQEKQNNLPLYNKIKRTFENVTIHLPTAKKHS